MGLPPDSGPAEQPLKPGGLLSPDDIAAILGGTFLRGLRSAGIIGRTAFNLGVGETLLQAVAGIAVTSGSKTVEGILDTVKNTVLSKPIHPNPPGPEFDFSHTFDFVGETAVELFGSEQDKRRIASYQRNQLSLAYADELQSTLNAVDDVIKLPPSRQVNETLITLNQRLGDIAFAEDQPLKYADLIRSIGTVVEVNNEEIAAKDAKDAMIRRLVLDEGGGVAPQLFNPRPDHGDP